MLMTLLAGCGSGLREQMVDEIKKDLIQPEPTKPGIDHSGLDASLDRTGESAGNLWDGLTDLASQIGREFGTGLKEVAGDIGSSAGEAVAKLGKEEDGTESGDAQDGEKDGKKASVKNPRTANGEVPEGPFHIEKVVDGDTVRLKETGFDTGSDIRYRLIGIDTPESVAPEESGKTNTTEGKEASSFLKEYLPKGTVVYIEYDAGREDKYGRQLIYLYAEKDGELVFVNELLLKEGLARLFTLPPNVRYADNVLPEAQEYARENGRGFWGTGFFDE